MEVGKHLQRRETAEITSTSLCRVLYLMDMQLSALFSLLDLGTECLSVQPSRFSVSLMLTRLCIVCAMYSTIHTPYCPCMAELLDTYRVLLRA